MDADIGSTEYWKDIRKARQENRADNRKNSSLYLSDHGIEFTSKNGDAHLIVKNGNSLIDFWPGTGRWISRCGRKGFGVRNLVKFISESNNGATK